MNFINTGIKSAIKALYETDLDEKEINLQETRKEFDGEVTLVVFPLIKISKKSPEITANEIGEWLVKNIN